jgi:carbon-monoxide dehydrogenase large subunit
MLLGMRVSTFTSMGAYLQLETPGVPVLGRMLFTGQYAARGYAFEMTAVFTNEPRRAPIGAWAGRRPRTGSSG